MKTNALIDILQYIQHLGHSVVSGFFPKAMMSYIIILYLFLFDQSHTQVLLSLFVLIIFDFVSGVTAAKIRGEPLLSSKFKHSGIKVFAYYGAISGAHLAESGLADVLSIIDETVIAFFLLTELISLLENIGKAGYSTPQKLLNQLNDYKAKY